MIPLATVQPLGVNVALEQYDDKSLRRALQLIRDGGYHWIRQHFPWSEIEPQRGDYRWERWDAIIEAAREYGLEIIAVLDTSPAWARAEVDADNPLAPPEDVDAYSDFALTFARRYGSAIDYYQIWDQPNIAPCWGERAIDPAGYVRLLRAGYLQIKAEDHYATILSAGLAPNVEAGGRNMSDIRFLSEMYKAGGRGYFDILGVKAYGFWSGPEDRRVDAAVLNLSRTILLREEMVRNGDAEKAVWAVEFGWNALPTDWRGRPSPWGTDAEEKQAERTIRALERIQSEWPWMGAICLQHFQPNAPPDDPVYGFALVSSDFTPRLLYTRILEEVVRQPVAYPGRYTMDSPLIQYGEGWSREKTAAVATASGAELIFPFWGTRVDASIEGDIGIEALRVLVDGKPVEIGARSNLKRVSTEQERRILARGLPAGRHVLRLVVSDPRAGIRISNFIVRRDADFRRYYFLLAVIGVGVVLAIWRIERLILLLPWRAWWGYWREKYLGLHDWQQTLLFAACVALFYVCPWFGLSALLLLSIAGLIYLRPDLGLSAIVAAAPLRVYAKPFGSFHLTLVEILTLLCLAIYILRIWQQKRRQYRLTLQREGLQTTVVKMFSAFSSMDWAILFFALVSIFSLSISSNLRVSLRELRVVVLESLILYLLLRNQSFRLEQLVRLLDILIIVGFALSMHGLYQYVFTDEVIVAEGVRRVRSIYGSPNNLSLVLGRIIPVAISMALLSPKQRRRVACGLACIPMLICLFLTYSRGAWLLGLPATLLFIGMMRGRRGTIIALLVSALGMVVLLPFVGTERIASLFQFGRGTTFLRLRLWEATIHMIRDHPIFGVGLDNFLYHYPDYILPGAEIEPGMSHPHNLVLDFWVRLGIPGLISLVWLLSTFFRSGLRLYRRFDDGYERAIVLGCMGSMVDFVAHGLIDNSFFLVELSFIFMLSLGMIHSLADRASQER